MTKPPFSGGTKEPTAGRTRAPRDARGRFRSPWDGPEDVRDARHLLRWVVERWRKGGLPPLPADGVPRATHEIAQPVAKVGAVRLTWVGHSTVLIQMGGVNLLTDPIWSRRASPVRWAGPSRISPPGVLFSELPPLDAVLLSHDHYDHLDDPTVRRLADRFGGLRWFTPLGYGDWLRERGAARVVEMDWWETAELSSRAGPLSVTSLPARHWSRRRPFDTNRRLWSSFLVSGPSGSSVYFGGDSGYCPAFREIGQELGPFDAAILPIGGYEPRWFMKPQHMSPEEAVQAYRDLGGAGGFMGVHWGGFQLTDEPVLEPPERARAAWKAAGLAQSDLWIPAVGETRRIRPTAEAATRNGGAGPVGR